MLKQAIWSRSIGWGFSPNSKEWRKFLWYKYCDTGTRGNYAWGTISVQPTLVQYKILNWLKWTNKYNYDENLLISYILRVSNIWSNIYEGKFHALQEAVWMLVREECIVGKWWKCDTSCHFYHGSMKSSWTEIDIRNLRKKYLRSCIQHDKDN